MDMKKNLLIIGSGGREHALVWKLRQSPLAGKIFCAPGNAGIAAAAECVDLPDTAAIVEFCKAQEIALVVIGPEQPLVEGLADVLREEGIAVFGPGAQAARLEGSKSFTKALCRTYGIPTAAYHVFTRLADAHAYLLSARQSSFVIKADGLAAGKGVVIAHTHREAEEAVEEMFAGTFGAAGQTVVIEEFLEGEEVSFFALCDGEHAIPFGHAQDHKRAFDGDKGPNTGGMGAFAPAPVFTAEMESRVMREIIRPTVTAMKNEGTPFIGVLFAGLMLTAEGPKLLEYNARFGDPETQVLMRRMAGDLLPLLEACAQGNLPEMAGNAQHGAAVCVVMASRGYPGEYQKGSVIHGLEDAASLLGVEIFHAGTARRGDEVTSAGGRVLGVTASGESVTEAQALAYRAVDRIDWPEGFCRRDIGWRALKKA